MLERLQPSRLKLPRPTWTKPRGPARRRALAERLALAKARAVAAAFPGAVVIGLPTRWPTWHGEPLGKPGTHENAVAQLRPHAQAHRGLPDRLAVVCLASGYEARSLARESQSSAI